MKRKHNKHYKELISWYKIFKWSQCSKCGDDFRREKGWRALIGGFGKYTNPLYLCYDCAPTREDADRYFLGRDWMPPKGPPPPLPPRPVTGGK